MYIRDLQTLLRRNIINKEKSIIVPLNINCFGLQGLGIKELINGFLFIFLVTFS